MSSTGELYASKSDRPEESGDGLFIRVDGVNPLLKGVLWLICQDEFIGWLSTAPFMKSCPPFGDGELVGFQADGDDSWLVTIAESGEASRDPLVVRPCMDWVIEFCCT